MPAISSASSPNSSSSSGSGRAAASAATNASAFILSSLVQYPSPLLVYGRRKWHGGGAAVNMVMREDVVLERSVRWIVRDPGRVHAGRHAQLVDLVQVALAEHLGIALRQLA